MSRETGPRTTGEEPFYYFGLQDFGPTKKIDPYIFDLIMHAAGEVLKKERSYFYWDSLGKEAFQTMDTQEKARVMETRRHLGRYYFHMALHTLLSSVGLNPAGIEHIMGGGFDFGVLARSLYRLKDSLTPRIGLLTPSGPNTFVQSWSLGSTVVVGSPGADMFEEELKVFRDASPSNTEATFAFAVESANPGECLTSGDSRYYKRLYFRPDRLAKGDEFVGKASFISGIAFKGQEEGSSVLGKRLRVAIAVENQGEFQTISPFAAVTLDNVLLKNGLPPQTQENLFMGYVVNIKTIPSGLTPEDHGVPHPPPAGVKPLKSTVRTHLAAKSYMVTDRDAKEPCDFHPASKEVKMGTSLIFPSGSIFRTAELAGSVFFVKTGAREKLDAVVGGVLDPEDAAVVEAEGLTYRDFAQHFPAKAISLFFQNHEVMEALKKEYGVSAKNGELLTTESFLQQMKGHLYTVPSKVVNLGDFSNGRYIRGQRQFEGVEHGVLHVPCGNGAYNGDGVFLNYSSFRAATFLPPKFGEIKCTLVGNGTNNRTLELKKRMWVGRGVNDETVEAMRWCGSNSYTYMARSSVSDDRQAIVMFLPDLRALEDSSRPPLVAVEAEPKCKGGDSGSICFSHLKIMNAMGMAKKDIVVTYHKDGDTYHKSDFSATENGTYADMAKALEENPTAAYVKFRVNPYTLFMWFEKFTFLAPVNWRDSIAKPRLTDWIMGPYYPPTKNPDGSIERRHYKVSTTLKKDQALSGPTSLPLHMNPQDYHWQRLDVGRPPRFSYNTLDAGLALWYKVITSSAASADHPYAYPVHIRDLILLRQTGVLRGLFDQVSPKPNDSFIKPKYEKGLVGAFKGFTGFGEEDALKTYVTENQAEVASLIMNAKPEGSEEPFDTTRTGLLVSVWFRPRSEAAQFKERIRVFPPPFFEDKEVSAASPGPREEVVGPEGRSSTVGSHALPATFDEAERRLKNRDSKFGKTAAVWDLVKAFYSKNGKAGADIVIQCGKLETLLKTGIFNSFASITGASWSGTSDCIKGSPTHDTTPNLLTVLQDPKTKLETGSRRKTLTIGAFTLNLETPSSGESKEDPGPDPEPKPEPEPTVFTVPIGNPLYKDNMENVLPRTRVEAMFFLQGVTTDVEELEAFKEILKPLYEHDRKKVTDEGLQLECSDIALMLKYDFFRFVDSIEEFEWVESTEKDDLAPRACMKNARETVAGADLLKKLRKNGGFEFSRVKAETKPRDLVIRGYSLRRVSNPIPAASYGSMARPRRGIKTSGLLY